MVSVSEVAGELRPLDRKTHRESGDEKMALPWQVTRCLVLCTQLCFSQSPWLVLSSKTDWQSPAAQSTLTRVKAAPCQVETPPLPLRIPVVAPGKYFSLLGYISVRAMRGSCEIILEWFLRPMGYTMLNYRQSRLRPV